MHQGKKKSAIEAVGPILLAAAIGVAGAWAWSSRDSRHRAPEAAVGEVSSSEDGEASAPAPAAFSGDTGAEPIPALASPAEPPPEPEPAPPSEPPAPAAPAEPDPASQPPASRLLFDEIWAYILPGGERFLSPAKPITDICLFDLALDHAGRLRGDVNVERIATAAALGSRTHLVVASSGNSSLLHLILTPRYGVRKKLIQDLARLPRRHRVDGIQLDFEGPNPEEREELVRFIGELRSALPEGCILSLALPAKSADKPAGWVYADLPGKADRFFIMTYDQHWKGGPPGPISDLPWLGAVLDCVGAKLPPAAVVVGLPFYGRVWQIDEVAGALTHPQAGDLAARKAVEVRRESARSPTFTFKAEVTAECWFEDAASLRAKLESAHARGFGKIGFWRLGQEDPRIWEMIGKKTSEKAGEKSGEKSGDGAR